jgi:hypothetical protein
MNSLDVLLMIILQVEGMVCTDGELNKCLEKINNSQILSYWWYAKASDRLNVQKRLQNREDGSSSNEATIVIVITQ